jgi:hypothetical protein
VVRKLSENIFAYKLKRGWGNGIYIDLENKSCSKERIELASFLTLHKTHTTKKSNPLTQELSVNTPGTPLPY